MLAKIIEIVCYNCGTKYEVETNYEDYGECPICGRGISIEEYLSDME